jgi:hypothetical protein
MWDTFVFEKETMSPSVCGVMMPTARVGVCSKQDQQKMRRGFMISVNLEGKISGFRIFLLWSGEGGTL